MTFDCISNRLHGAARSGLSLVAVLAIMGVCAAPVATMLIPSAAQAQDDHTHEDGGGEGGQGGNGPGPGGGGSGGSGGHDDGGHDDGGHEDTEDHEGGSGGSGGGQGQGGPGEDSDGQGPQGGGPSDSAGGGRPPWAAEGIPEIELGRLSVARSPDHVLDRAYDEALLTMASMADFYNLSLEDMITQLSLNWDDITIVDSPLQNLSLLRDALDGSIDLSAVGITNDIDTLMAVFLGVASDKTVPITTETAYAISVIFEMPLTEAEAAALAADAEAIRIAVLAGHG